VSTNRPPEAVSNETSPIVLVAVAPRNFVARGRIVAIDLITNPDKFGA